MQLYPVCPYLSRHPQPHKESFIFYPIIGYRETQSELLFNSDSFRRDKYDSNPYSLEVQHPIHEHLPYVFLRFHYSTFVYSQNFRLLGCEFCNKVCQDLPFDRGSRPMLNIKSSQRSLLFGYPYPPPPKKFDLLSNACKGCTVSTIIVWA